MHDPTAKRGYVAGDLLSRIRDFALADSGGLVVPRIYRDGGR